MLASKDGTPALPELSYDVLPLGQAEGSMMHAQTTFEKQDKEDRNKEEVRKQISGVVRIETLCMSCGRAVVSSLRSRTHVYYALSLCAKLMFAAFGF